MKGLVCSVIFPWWRSLEMMHYTKMSGNVIEIHCRHHALRHEPIRIRRAGQLMTASAKGTIPTTPSFRRKKAKMGAIHGKRVGQEIPPLMVTDQDGSEIRLADFRGNWLLLVFHRHLA
jgi:AhpC/TSA family